MGGAAPLRSDNGLEGQAPRLVYEAAHTLILGAPLTPYLDAGIAVPVSIFSGELSGLQAIVRYLHDARKLSFSEISALLARSPKTVWATYQAARNARFPYAEGGLSIPVSKFAERTLSVLETIVCDLSAYGFSNIEIARMLALDPRTTWTVKRRAAKKGVSP
jgi:hypothetical protein